MKRSLICVLLIIAALLCTGCAGNEPESSSKKPSKKPSSSSSSGNNNTNNSNPIVEQLIASIGTEGVALEFGKIETGRYGDSAPVTAQVPNYTELFTAACTSENPTEALARAIEKKDFTTVEYTGYAAVTYDGDTPVYDTEMLVKDFIEQELIKAINAVTESEEAA